jgi:hypothetical protein
MKYSQQQITQRDELRNMMKKAAVPTKTCAAVAVCTSETNLKTNKCSANEMVENDINSFTKALDTALNSSRYGIRKLFSLFILFIFAEMFTDMKNASERETRIHDYLAMCKARVGELLVGVEKLTIDDDPVRCIAFGEI